MHRDLVLQSFHTLWQSVLQLWGSGYMINCNCVRRYMLTLFMHARGQELHSPCLHFVFVCSMGIEVRHAWGMTETSPIATAGTLKVCCIISFSCEHEMEASLKLPSIKGP